MTKLNQILALEKGVKEEARKTLEVAYHKIQKPALFSGISRTYKPLADGGEGLPPESTRVQVTVGQLLVDVVSDAIRLYDLTATKEVANTQAKADVKVDGKVIVQGAPVTLLLFLEKQLVDLNTFILKLPLLDPSETWTLDPNTGVYVNETSETNRTEKTLHVLEKAPATDKHPAQTEVYSRDVTVGHWRTTKFSGAILATDQKKMIERVRDLSEAVKLAREEANSLKVEDVKIGQAVLEYIFG